ncbi:hypothetical Protein pso3_08190 [Candidatus Phytoplasma solani]
MVVLFVFFKITVFKRTIGKRKNKIVLKYCYVKTNLLY